MDPFSDIRTVLDTEAAVSGWRWHDLRRNFATAFANASAQALFRADLPFGQCILRGAGLIPLEIRVETTVGQSEN